jgi:copper chaperone CopZ
MGKKLNISRYSWWAAVLSLLLLWPAMTVLAGEPGARIGRTTLVVEKLTCGACFRVIDAELRKIPGILGETANLAAGRVTVDHELTLTPVEVAAAVTASGYPARVAEVQTLARRDARIFSREAGFGSGPGCCNLGGANPVADSWRELRRRFMRLGNNGRARGRDAGPTHR